MNIWILKIIKIKNCSDIIKLWKAQQQENIIRKTIQNGLINFNNKFNPYGLPKMKERIRRINLILWHRSVSKYVVRKLKSNLSWLQDSCSKDQH